MADHAARSMFGTWKYDPETDEVQNLRRSFDPVTARSSQHQACNRCHEKKLKCSGDKNGCDRCVANQLACEYTRSSPRPPRQGKKHHRRSAEPREHNCPSTGSSPTDGSSRSSHGRPPGRRRHESGAAVPGTGTLSTDAPVTTPYALNHVEEILRPEDAFDMGLIDGMPATTDAYGAYPAGVAVSAYPGWAAQGYAVPGTGVDSYGIPTTQGYEGDAYGGFQQYGEYQDMDPRYWSRGR